VMFSAPAAGTVAVVDAPLLSVKPQTTRVVKRRGRPPAPPRRVVYWNNPPPPKKKVEPPPVLPPRTELRRELDGSFTVCFTGKRTAGPRLCAERNDRADGGPRVLDASSLRIDLALPTGGKKAQAAAEEAVVVVFFAESRTFNTDDFVRLARDMFVHAGRARAGGKRVVITVGHPRGTPTTDLNGFVHAGVVPAARMTGDAAHQNGYSCFGGPIARDRRSMRRRKKKAGFVRSLHAPNWVPDPRIRPKPTPSRKRRRDAGATRGGTRGGAS
jgi:hypothetical protein